MFDLGTIIQPSVTPDTNLSCDAPELLSHLHKPWLSAYLKERFGLLPPVITSAVGERLKFSELLLTQHVGLLGKTGMGKTYGRNHILLYHISSGGSAIIFDPKREDIETLLAHLRRLKIPPERIIVISPHAADQTPGYNVFATGLPESQVASDVVTILAAIFSGFMGPRLQNLLTSLCIVIGAHSDLSLFEVIRALTRDEYLKRLLELPATPSDPFTYSEAVDFLKEEYLKWSAMARIEAAAAISNKLRELLRVPVLRNLLCARRNTLALPHLWQEQCVVLVHLDPATLGDLGAQLLAGLLCSGLFRTALRGTGGAIPVMLAIDEVGLIERFIGPILVDILTVARSLNLRLLLATQHLSGLTDELRTALLANAGLLTTFRLGHADAKLFAASLAAGTPTRITRASLKSDPGRGQRRVLWRHPLRDGSGQPLRLGAVLWQQLRTQDLFGAGALGALQHLAAAHGISRLYLTDPVTEVPVALSHYVSSLAPEDYWIEGPAPLELVVSFPRPLLDGVERYSEADALRQWTGVLESLPVQHTVVRVGGQTAGIVKIADVITPVRDDADAAYREAVLNANGQTPQAVAETLAWRQAEVERVSRSVQSRGRKETNDGSIA